MWPNLFEQIIQQNSNESLNSEDRQKIHQSSFSSSSYGLQNSDCTDLDFIYDDTDSHSNEIAELYSYSEQHEFQHNVRAFDNILSSFNMIPSWQRLNKLEQKSIILKLLDQLDIAIKEERMKAARCLLYMAQGCWAEVQSDHEQYMWTRHNVKLLLELGGFNTFIELLNIEINNIELLAVTVRKINITLNDSIDLRCILNVIYIMIEVARNEAESDDFRKLTKDLILELNQPVAGGELFPVKLLQMITKFCSGHAPHFPMKKILLCLWKSCLLSLGGIEDLRKMKKELREKAGLDSQQEDTIEVAKLLRASSPPATAADILDTQQLIPQTISNINVSSSSHLGTIGSVQTIGGNSGAVCVGIKRTRPLRRVRTNEQFIPEQNLIKQSSLDEEQDISNEIDRQSDDEYSFPPVTESDDATGQTAAFLRNTQLIYDTTTSTQQMIYSNFPPPLLRLPWRPKVREKDIHQFLEISRSKFIGYTFNDDYKTLAGLPQPIHDGVSTLKKHRYISLSEKQIQHEDEISRTLMSAEVEISDTPTEILYRGILPNLPQYMIALLKILLAAAPTSKAKAESINIMADILPEEMPVTVTQSTRLGIDVNRHKEIIVKSVSAIILLLMKHLKLNHIYQFEFMSQHLVFANCIPLVLKFFNQHILNYVASKNVIPILDFPSCVIGDQVTTDFHTAENLCIGVTDAGSMTAQYSWRNIFSCINLLRILNKLTKWKHSRIMMLVVFKSAPILKRTLKVRHPLMQLYVLKLLKMQTKYLGRQWRKTNMKTISAIYSKVRHRLNDDWAFGNDLDARPWDFQAEECILRTCVDRFNSRRYFQQIINNVCNEQSSQTVINDVLPNESDQVTNLQLYTENQQYHMDKPIQLSFPLDIVMYEDQFSLTVAFERNYLNWLNEEVYNKNIDWDILVNSTDNYF